jgi:hypothetical protein
MKSPGVVTNLRFPMIYMVEGGGFEPPKSLTTDLQSVPFGRSGIPPGMIGTNVTCVFLYGAPYPNRTDHLLITSQLLYQYELTGPNPFLDRKKSELVYLKKKSVEVKH